MTEEELNKISQAASASSKLAAFLDGMDRHFYKNLDRELLYIVWKYESKSPDACVSVPFYGYDTASDNLRGAAQELKTAIEDFESVNSEGMSVENASIYASMSAALRRIYTVINEASQ